MNEQPECIGTYMRIVSEFSTTVFAFCVSPKIAKIYCNCYNQTIYDYGFQPYEIVQCPFGLLFFS